MEKILIYMFINGNTKLTDLMGNVVAYDVQISNLVIRYGI